ncbi:MAG: class IV adenylate cyclase [Nanoarchaeota archaeon]|nr:class IV adenylate cyclase [Nanoarchaeota archaeon]
MVNEVEVEVKLKYENKDELVSKLKFLKAKRLEEFFLHDIYFSLSYSDVKNNHDILRIRTKGSSCELTFKSSSKNIDEVWERTEISVDLSDEKLMRDILTNLGFSVVSENKSNREVWKIGDVELVFIDFIFPVEFKILEIESDDLKKVESMISNFDCLVSRIGEDDFKMFDDARKKSS